MSDSMLHPSLGLRGHRREREREQNMQGELGRRDVCSFFEEGLAADSTLRHLSGEVGLL